MRAIVAGLRAVVCSAGGDGVGGLVWATAAATR